MTITSATENKKGKRNQLQNTNTQLQTTQRGVSLPIPHRLCRVIKAASATLSTS